MSFAKKNLCLEYTECVLSDSLRVSDVFCKGVKSFVEESCLLTNDTSV